MMWQPIETLTENEINFIVYWQESTMGKPEIDMIGSYKEYQEILGYGEPPATYWFKLPELPEDK